MATLMNIRADGSEYDVNFWIDTEEVLPILSQYITLISQDTSEDVYDSLYDIVSESISEDLVNSFFDALLGIKNHTILVGIQESIKNEKPMWLSIPGFCITDYQQS